MAINWHKHTFPINVLKEYSVCQCLRRVHYLKHRYTDQILKSRFDQNTLVSSLYTPIFKNFHSRKYFVSPEFKPTNLYSASKNYPRKAIISATNSHTSRDSVLIITILAIFRMLLTQNFLPNGCQQTQSLCTKSYTKKNKKKLFITTGALTNY